MVRFGRHPPRWSAQRLKRLGLALVLAHIGTLIIVALYYLVFQVHYHVAGHTYTLKHWWDTTVSNADLRHSIRNVAEGVLGGWLAKAVVWNHYKHRRRGPIERLEERLHVPRVLIAPVMVAAYFAVAFTALYWLFHALRIHASASSASGPHPSLWSRTAPLWTSQWNQKLIAFAVAFVCCRPLFPVFDDIQLWFAERRAYRQRPPRWWQADTYQARVNDVAASGITKRSHGWLFNSLMSVSVIAGLALAGYGWYVLTYIAKG
jgi:hypothetical protein